MKNSTFKKQRQKYGKCNLELEEPISKLLYYISYRISKKINMNPNLITTSRLLIMFLVYYLIHKNYLIVPGILYLFCYFLDHLDGEMSRQNKTYTLFGDYYDHSVDLLYELPVFYLLYLKYREGKLYYLYIIIFFTLIINSSILVLFQESQISEKNNKAKSNIISNFLRIYSGLHGKDPILYYKFNISKYFGQGLFHLFIFYLIIKKKLK